jgi:hypothetical protein
VAALVAIETVVLVLLTVLVAGLLRSHAAILRQLHEMGAGLDPDAPRPPVANRPLTPAPAGTADGSDVTGAGLRDDAISLRVVDVEHRTLLAFLSSSCLTCRTFWDAFGGRDPLGVPDDVRVVVVTKDAAEEQPSVLRGLAPAHVPLVMSSAAWASYSVPGAPYFVLVDGPSGRVEGEGTGASWPQVLGLVLQSEHDGASARRSGAPRSGAPRSGAPRRGAQREVVDPAALDATNEARIDRALLAAGIRPGDPSLYQTAVGDDPDHASQ